MKRREAAKTARQIRQVIRLLDRKIAEMEAEFAATPDPARRPLRRHERN
jgi:hypothetical protein